LLEDIVTSRLGRSIVAASDPSCGKSARGLGKRTDAPSEARRTLCAWTRRPPFQSGESTLSRPPRSPGSEAIGETKARMLPATVFALAVLAGAFIALGAIF